MSPAEALGVLWEKDMELPDLQSWYLGYKRLQLLFTTSSGFATKSDQFETINSYTQGRAHKGARVVRQLSPVAGSR